jgi:membrane associated rhomboid family serine protease
MVNLVAVEKHEKKKFINAIFYPALFVVILAIIHFVQYAFDLNFYQFGIFPKETQGLVGIITSIFIHGNFNHLFNNAIPLLILGSALFYFYKPVAVKIVVWIVLMGGFWTWVMARESYHIGASGLIYGLFSFLLVSGFIRLNKQLIALSFFVVIVYGSMVWGIFPIKLSISYEAHFWGFVSGIILAIFYRKQGLQKEIHIWEEDEGENEKESENQYWKTGYDDEQYTVNYKEDRSPKSEDRS